MNKMQRIIITVGASVIILMGLIPPWSFTFNAKSVHRSKPAGYALIIAPPSPEKGSIAFGVELDIKRLLVQWIVVGIATGLGYFLTNRVNGTNTEKGYKNYIEDLNKKSTEIK